MNSRREASDAVGYWNGLARSWRGTHPHELWRIHCDAVNEALLARWLPEAVDGPILKTDSFDEAVGEGFAALLQARGRGFVSMDISSEILAWGRSRHPGLSPVQADARRLPFADGSFACIVSLSTLDHFERDEEIDVALAELARVLRPGGTLLFTLDNAANPVLAIRASVPCAFWERIGIMPYQVGPSRGPQRAREGVVRAGFEILDEAAIMHCPRLLMCELSGPLAAHLSPAGQRRWLRFLGGWERLASLPTRYATGYFVAIRAVRGAR